MTPTDFRTLMREIRARWPNVDWPTDTVRILQHDLTRYDLAAAQDGIRMLAAEGDQWAPVPGRIVAATQEQHANRHRYPTHERPALEASKGMTGTEYRDTFWDGATWDQIITAHTNERTNP